MRRTLLRNLDEELRQRVLEQGGLLDRPQGQFRVDATAWGILALEASGTNQHLLTKHRTRLISEQDTDGRVCLSREHREAYWPTALAILAWGHSPPHDKARNLAAKFLLDTSGIHYTSTAGSPWTHDTRLRGWSWIEHTDSWVVPTAVSVIALRAAGHREHRRVQEAYTMLLDRQLPHGGWNAGNTIIFGKELHANPECTGVALTSLAGGVDRVQVATSIDYLQREVDRLRTPIDLGWGLLGLAAWGEWPRNGEELATRCLANQSRYGQYETSALGILYLGTLAGEAERVQISWLTE
jgi:hypothetical protein